MIGGAQPSQHAGVLKADGAGRGLGGGAVPDQVLGAFQAQRLRTDLVTAP